MDYKLFQKAIADRLGSHFTITLIIVFAFLNWELLFILADMSRSIDEKIICVKAEYWSLQKVGIELMLTFALIVSFHLFSYITKIIGLLFNDTLWGYTLKGFKLITKYVSIEEFDLAVADRDKYVEISKFYSSERDALKQEAIDSQAEAIEKGNEVSDQKKKARDLQAIIDDQVISISNYQDGVSSLVDGITSINTSQYHDPARDHINNASLKFMNTDSKGEALANRINRSFEFKK